MVDGTRTAGGDMELLTMALQMAVTCVVLAVAVFGIMAMIFRWADWRERQG